MTRREPGKVGRGQASRDVIGHGENLGLYSQKEWEAI